MLAIGISAASYAMGLILKDEDAFAPFIQGVSLPLLLLSGVLLPMSLAPALAGDGVEGQPAHARGRRHAERCSAATSATATSCWAPPSPSSLSALLAWWGARVFQRQSA